MPPVMSVDATAPNVPLGLNRAEVEQLDFSLHQGAKLSGIGSEVADRVAESLKSRASSALGQSGSPRILPIDIAELFAEPKEQVHGRGSIVAEAVSSSAGSVGSSAVAAEAEKHIRGAVPNGGQATEDMVAAAKYSARGIDESSPGREESRGPGRNSHRQAMAEPQADAAANPVAEKNKERNGLPTGIQAKGDFAKLQAAIKTPLAEDDGMVDLDPELVANTLKVKERIADPTALESAQRKNSSHRHQIEESAALSGTQPTEIPSILASTDTAAKIGPTSAPLLAAKPEAAPVNNVAAFRPRNPNQPAPALDRGSEIRQGLSKIIEAQRARVLERLAQAA